MLKYHKIQTIYKRGKDHKLLPGEFSLPEFEYLYNNTWELTEKVDGTNIRVCYNGAHQVFFYGRSDNVQIPPFLLNKLQLMFPVDLFIDNDMPEMYLYGEGYGNKIQKIGSKYIEDGVSFILFDVNCGDLWLCREDVYDIADRLNLKTAPVYFNGTLEQAETAVKVGFPSLIGDCPAEGLVCRPQVEMLNRRGFRIIAKIKHKDFKELEL